MVNIQNLVGNHQHRLDRSGVVTEVLGNTQYFVKVDGTGRFTRRNREHLKDTKVAKQVEKPVVPNQRCTAGWVLKRYKMTKMMKKRYRLARL